MPRHLSALLIALLLLAAPGRAIEYPKPTGAPFAQSFPYSMVGQLIFTSGRFDYSGTATVIRERSVITAGHNIYDFRGGWSTDVLFLRAHYNGENLSEQFGSRLFVLGGYRSNVARFGGDDVRTFPADLGGVRFAFHLANGGYAGWSTEKRLLTGTSYNIVLGYGGEHPHSGEELLFAEPRLSFYKRLSAFFENDSIYIESGMSGGPVFARGSDDRMYVTAVVVSGSVNPISGGVRVLNGKAARFIRQHLR